MGVGVVVLVRVGANSSPAGNQRGHIIEIRPIPDLATYPFTGLEGWPTYVHLYLHGVDPAKTRRFKLAEYNTDEEPLLPSGAPNPAFPENPTLVHKRRWRFLLDTIPQGVKDKIVENNGVLHIGGATPDYTWNQVRSYIQDQRTNNDLSTVEASEME